ncbi:MAG: hypothetical protein SO471_04325 [Anaerobutyricum hallii]|uniref:hypothetical protein n=1 Tax=Anaerobutyricum hallii TaxID=39488 RepID=UPI002A8399DF|nr:hypothetical protein [Anaerobutyricum hallii]MDY4577208.1 hypothetical protein [Anaerobutyricum hallii]
METRTNIYAVAKLDGGYYYVVEKKKITSLFDIEGEGLTIEKFKKDNMEYIENLKKELEFSDCLYTIGNSGEVGIADYAEELMWYPQIKNRFVRELTEDDRKAISEAIEEAERKHLKEMEQYEMDFYIDKNNQLQYLKKGMMELIDNTLGYDMEWRLDNLEEAKRKIEEIEDTTGMINFFSEVYDYVYSLEDSDEWVEDFQEFGHDELDVRFCEKCGSMFCAGYYFPNFMYEKEGVCEYMCEDCFEALPTETKEAWDEFYSDDGEDYYSEWGI